MTGQFLHMGIEEGWRKLLHSLRNRVVHSGPLTCQQLAVNSLPRQSMAKRELLTGFFDHKLSRNQRFHDQEKLLLTIPGKLLEQGKIKMPTGHSGQGQDLSGRFPQVLRSLMHSILHTMRNVCDRQRFTIPVALGIENIACHNHSAQSFFYKKGITLRQRIKRLQQFSMQKATHIERRVLLIEER